VISQVDDVMRELVRTRARVGADVEVVFDAPTKDWAARRNAPTVNLYLYDIREDLRRRERGWSEERGADGNVVARRPAPRFFKLSYLVTAWTQRPEDEHRLLDSLLRCFLSFDAVPRELVDGELAETGLDVPVTVGLPPPEDRGFADVWSALGGELKPSIDVVVIAPIDTGVVYEVGPPVTEGPYVDLADLADGGSDARRHQHVPPPKAEAVGSGSSRAGGSTTARRRSRRT
jgi:hypothetical protein